MADDPEDPREALGTAIARNARDWSQDKTLAWVYGIILGWGDGLDAVAERHGWKPADVQRLRRLHANFTILTTRTEERAAMATISTTPTYSLDEALRIRDDLASELEHDIQAIPAPETFDDLKAYALLLAEQLIANGWVTAVPIEDDAEAGQ